MDPTARLLFVGHLGGKNVGDDAMMVGLIEGLGRARPAMRILAKDPHAVSGLPEFVEVRRARIWPLIAGLVWASHLVLVGGTHFHDDYRPERFRRHFAYMSRYVAVSILARVMGRRVCWTAQGIGPIRRPVTRFLLRFGIRVASVVSVRDTRSRTELLRVAAVDAPVAPDPAFVLVDRPRHATTCDQRKVVGVALTSMAHAWGGDGKLDDVVLSQLTEALTRAHAASLVDLVDVFAFRGGDREPDMPVASRLSAALRAQSIPTRITPYHPDPRQVLSRIRLCSAVVAMRYHAGVLAVAAQRPVLLLAYHRKVQDLAADLNIDRRLVIDPRAEIPAGLLAAAIDYLMKEAQGLPARQVALLSAKARNHSHLILES